MGEVYLRSCGEEHRSNILHQVALTEKLRAISDTLKQTQKPQRDALLRKQLEEIEFPECGITLPVDPKYAVLSLFLTVVANVQHRLRAKGLIIEKCRSMDSFTVPLWLVFENAEEMVRMFPHYITAALSPSSCRVNR